LKFPSIDDFNNTLSDINKYIHKTPIVSSSSLNKIYNSNIFFKLELFQKTGSFKTRGAINKLLKLSDLERDKGIITISAGNHAQAISWACSQFNIKSKIGLLTKCLILKLILSLSILISNILTFTISPFLISDSIVEQVSSFQLRSDT